MGPGFSALPHRLPGAQGDAAQHRRDLGGDQHEVRLRQISCGGSTIGRSSATRSLRRAASSASATMARAEPLAAPLAAIAGLSPKLGTAIQRAAAQAGRTVLAAPAGRSAFGADAAAGSAFGVGYASDDITASAIRTVTYTDGDQVWGFGHPLEAVDARALLLQDAYVYRVVRNPTAIPGVADTYKYAATGHDPRDADQRHALRGRGSRRRAAGDDSGPRVRDRSRYRHEALGQSRTLRTSRASTSRPAARSSRSWPLALTSGGHDPQRLARPADRARVLR